LALLLALIDLHQTLQLTAAEAEAVVAAVDVDNVVFSFLL
jgi:hypothetical protein